MVSVWLLCGAAVLVHGQAPERHLTALHIPRITRPPKLTDFLNNVPREAELVISDFRQFMPGDGVPVSQPTTAYLSYDDRNLYVAFVCTDDPRQIRARYAKRDQIDTDDRFNVNIDTFHDHRHQYWFDINPYGVQAEGNTTDGVEDDSSWDTVWHSDARVTADGYIGIAIIPFKSIRFPAESEQTWGLMLGRWIMRNNEFALWPDVSRKRPGFVRQGGDLEGFHDISPGRNVQLTPYGLLTEARYLDGPQFRTKTEVRGGLDAKMIVKDAFTLDVALNPDFSQVESDEPQTTVNQRFEVYYPEKRPFFLENAGYFKTPQQVFFSRRIADPRFGARLTGKSHGWSIGALFADDRGPGKVAAEDDPERDRIAQIGVVRIQRDFLKDSNAAAMVTREDFGPTHNRVFSLDTRLHVLPNWILTAQAMTTDTRLRDGTHLAGPGYYLSWNHSGKHFISQTSYEDRSPGFRSDLGYFQRVDVRHASHTAGYKWRPERGALQAFGPKLSGMINYDHRGRLEDWVIEPEFGIELSRVTSLAIGREERYEYFGVRGFRRGTNYATIASDWQKWLAFQAVVAQGTAINYRPGPGLAPFLADFEEATLGFTLRPNARTRLDETYILDRLHMPGAAIYNNHIVRSKINYQFSREASLRFIADYNGVLANPALAQLERAKHVGIDALFTYMLNPGTALHAGYTDLYDNLRLDPSLSPALVRTGFPDLNTGRQVFVKLSYLFRF